MPRTKNYFKMKMILNLLVTAASAYLLGELLSGIELQDFSSAIVFAIVLGLLNMVVTPILKLIGLPLNILTLGLFSLVINAIVVYMASGIMQTVHIDNFAWALLFSFLLSIVSSVIGGIVGVAKNK